MKAFALVDLVVAAPVAVEGFARRRRSHVARRAACLACGQAALVPEVVVDQAGQKPPAKAIAAGSRVTATHLEAIP